MIELKVKAVSPLMGTKFPLPAYATAGAAAMDLCACIDQPVTLAAGERHRPAGAGVCGAGVQPQRHGHPPRHHPLQQRGGH